MLSIAGLRGSPSASRGEECFYPVIGVVPPPARQVPAWDDEELHALPARKRSFPQGIAEVRPQLQHTAGDRPRGPRPNAGRDCRSLPKTSARRPVEHRQPSRRCFTREPHVSGTALYAIAWTTSRCRRRRRHHARKARPNGETQKVTDDHLARSRGSPRKSVRVSLLSDGALARLTSGSRDTARDV